MQNCDYLIVGAGLTGITAASIIAREKEKSVIVVEKRNHIGGNCYDEYDENDILIHLYGPHIFHTHHKYIWDYLSQFTDWLTYVHFVKAWIKDKYVSFPINIHTLEDLFDKPFTEKTMQTWLDHEKVSIPTINNAEDMVVSRMGWFIYETFFKNYTKKQWGIDAKQLTPEITARIPIRINRQETYFTDPYEGIPVEGYTAMFNRMLDHERITVITGTDYKEIVKDIDYRKMIFTGPVDSFFDYKFGPLPYRGLNFEFKTYDSEKVLPVAQVNYPNDHEYTRATEFKHMTFQKHPKTTIGYETPADVDPKKNKPFHAYPILNEASKAIYEKYKHEAEREKNVIFIGRLAEFQYMNMDACVKRVLDYFN